MAPTPLTEAEQLARTRARFESTAKKLQSMLTSAPKLTRNFESSERTRAVRLDELDALLTTLDDAGLATGRDEELYGWLERWQKLGRESADSYRAGCRHLPRRRA